MRDTSKSCTQPKSETVGRSGNGGRRGLWVKLTLVEWWAEEPLCCGSTVSLTWIVSCSCKRRGEVEMSETTSQKSTDSEAHSDLPFARPDSRRELEKKTFVIRQKYGRQNPYIEGSSEYNANKFNQGSSSATRSFGVSNSSPYFLHSWKKRGMWQFIMSCVI